MSGMDKLAGMDEKEIALHHVQSVIIQDTTPAANVQLMSKVRSRMNVQTSVVRASR